MLHEISTTNINTNYIIQNKYKNKYIEKQNYNNYY